MNIVEFAKKYLGITLREHQIEWLQFIESNDSVLLLAPRGHGKTTIMYVYIVWKVCMDPNIRILIASHKEELANIFSRTLQRAFEREDIAEKFNLVRGSPWRIDHFYLQDKRYPVVQTVAKQAGMTGGRYDIVVFDDLLTVENTRTENRRVRMEEWINSEVIPSLDPSEKRKEIVVGTRKNLEDWYGRITEMEGFECRIDQLYETVDGEKVFLWPERFDEQEERRLRSRLTEQQFAREYMNSPIASEGLRFKRQWIEPYYYTNWRADVPERFREFFMGIDPSLGSKTSKASYMGLAVVCFDSRVAKQDIYVVDLVRSKLSLPEQEDIIKAKVEEWEPTAALIEGDLVNKVFSERMIRQLPVLQPVVYRAFGGSTNLRGSSDISKIGRIENIVGWLFKRGKIHFKDPKISPMSKTFIEAEYLQFPNGTLDLMDALNMACDRIDMRRQIQEFKIWKI